MIKTEEISVVIQGPILNNDKYGTKQSIESIRKYLPDAEIIVSTWQNEKLSDIINADKIVILKDPGSDAPYTFDHKRRRKNVPLNINRQILSTVEGIKQAKNPYVVKMRSDMFLTSNKFIGYFEKYSNENDNKILMANSHNPSNSYGNTFCINDFFQFGKKDEILKLWDIPFFSKEFCKNNCIQDMAVVPEEYVMLQYLDRNQDIYTIQEFYERKDYNIKKYFESILATRFIIIPFKKGGLNCYKYKNRNSFFDTYIKHTDYSHYDWLFFCYQNMNKRRIGTYGVHLFSCICEQLICILKIIIKRV